MNNIRIDIAKNFEKYKKEGFPCREKDQGKKCRFLSYEGKCIGQWFASTMIPLFCRRNAQGSCDGCEFLNQFNGCALFLIGDFITSRKCGSCEKLRTTFYDKYPAKLRDHAVATKSEET